MLRKILLTFLAVTVLMGVAFAAMFAVGGNSTPPPAPKTQRVTAPNVWDGAGRQALNLTTLRGDAQITLNEITYSKLNQTAADAAVTLTVKLPSANQPGWLNKNAFRLASQDGRIFDAKKVTIGFDQSQFVVSLAYHRLPTKRLTAGYETDKSAALGLEIFTPTGSYRVVLLPPPAPAGHAWGETVVDAPAKGRTFKSADRLLDRVAAALARGEEDPRVTAARNKREREAAARAAAKAKAAAAKKPKKSKR